MKAPTDKHNDTIQIIVTTACDLFNCSNCTQLLPFRKDKRHMSLDVFREACKSVADWPGIVGIFGGNPCSHPQFEQLMEIYVEEIPNQRNRGIWTNNLLGKGELVNKVFYPHGRFNLNAHADPDAAREIEKHLPGRLIAHSANRPAMHGAVLVDRRDVGVPDMDWARLRESCDVNTHWSSAIAERDGKPYVYFCEIAAALDGVRGVNNGLPATPGWWRQKMPFFQSQVASCCDQGCGVPLRMVGHLDRDDTYDVSMNWVTELEVRANTKVGFKVHDSMAERAAELTDYMRHRNR